MKINTIEEEIIKKYVIKSKQERILWEFSNPKKRDEVFWKFAGQDIFKRHCLKEIEYMSSDKLEHYLSQLNKNQNVYYIGVGYIGELLLKEAVKRANNEEICIIYCGNGIGYYQGEQEYGRTPRFLLIEQ